MVAAETAKAAGGFIKTLQNEPLSLALCVMNFALIGFVYLQSNQFNSQRQDNVKLFLDVQREVQKLLSECIVPPPTPRGQQQRGNIIPDDRAAVPIGGGP